MSLEVSGQVRLVVEADAHRDLRDRTAIEEPSPSGVDPTAEQVPVRRDPERPREAADQVGRGDVKEVAGFAKRERFEPPLIQEIAEVARYLGVGALGAGVRRLPQVVHQASRDHREQGLGHERVVRMLQRAVHTVELADGDRIVDVGGVDRAPYEALFKYVGPHVEDALTEPGARRGTTIMHDVRRQERHAAAGDTAMLGVQVVPDRALVHQEDGPRVVRVARVRVLDEPGVEHLVDPRHRRLPSSNPLLRCGHEASIVQDHPRPTGWNHLHDLCATMVRLKELAGFLAFAFVGTVSPGPNNAVLWVSGLSFGFRRTVPHVVGAAVGMGALTIGIAAGIGSLLEAVPAGEVALKLAGSIYLMYIAYLMLQGGSVTRKDVASPLTVWQGIWFQFLNPKAWVFTVAAVATFLPQGLPRALAIALLTGMSMVVVVGSSAIWAGGGVALGRLLDDEGSRRRVNIALAILLAASVALIWV